MTIFVAAILGAVVGACAATCILLGLPALPRCSRCHQPAEFEFHDAGLVSTCCAEPQEVLGSSPPHPE